MQSFNRQIESYLAGDGVEITPLLAAVAADPDDRVHRPAARRRPTCSPPRPTASRTRPLARQRLFMGIAVGGLVLALLVTWLASRSITRPLRSLKRQAEDMADTRLPAAVRQILDTPAGEDVVIPEVAPITVKTKDEVSQVAAALSKVQSSAVDLAVEQAVLRRNISDSYINLGRRNQNLLSRQLDFITDLERNEADPDTLEGLFRLDHLATRMRRNAESLLVLAGIEPPRQWSAPVKMADVVRAALGEVEDYQRVVVRNLEPAAVTGAVAADVAHVLAELIENGLSFSPPEQSVEVKGRLTTAGYTLAITDNGLGMAPDDVERANRRLAGKESFTVAPSRYLGHYVAGHLASRLGVVVELQDSPAGGVTARIDVPMGLLADDELDRTLAKAPSAEPVAEPVVAGPVAAAVSTETTASGLPRRGDRVVRSAQSRRRARRRRGRTHRRRTVARAPPLRSCRAAGSALRPGTATPSAPPVAPAGAGRRCPPAASAGSRSPRAARPCSRWPPSRRAEAERQRQRHASGARRRAGATIGGLARRVPGAQRPDASIVNRAPEPARPPSRPARPPRTSTRSSPTSSPAWLVVEPTPPTMTPPRHRRTGDDLAPPSARRRAASAGCSTASSTRRPASPTRSPSPPTAC